MSITSVIINVTDLDRSIDFYTRFLAAEPISRDDDHAVLDLISGTLRLQRIDNPADHAWVADDLHRGFRHIGFKVDDVDRWVAPLKEAGVRFHLDPLEATGDVRIAFFYDPDGTLCEFVARDLQYSTMIDEDGVAAERALGVPDRPRLDHVALTVDDRQRTADFYHDHFGFDLIGIIDQPQDPRGFSIGYLKAGPTVLEIFTYRADKQPATPQLDAPGFVAAEIGGSSGSPAGMTELGKTGYGAVITLDADGFPITLGAER
ncbi:VOC family protein [Microlunatus soli]|uniref:Catechol-2,3-dioxygenase n=1 Tax=Microlunatus soli TaxID=630515 RepID=A0A1H1NJK3_9ACTN|nr:VOC family protein [Microlunatus soli]SDR99138.1 Catechol-2,3-dioxygenase [Microlunatus soli]